MPNHIQNRLQFIGDSQDVKTVLDSIKGKDDDGTDTQIDFGKIVPMPESLRITSSNLITDPIKAVLKMKAHDNPLIAALEKSNMMNFRSPLELDDKQWAEFITGLNNVRNYGHITWYEWSIEHWGTKWNAYDQNDERNSSDTIFFQTAWSSPIELIRKLSDQHPQVKLILSYADEDSGSNTGIIELKEGKVLSCYQPKSGSKEGYDLYFELHPDSKDNYEWKNGKYEYVEEE